MEEKQENITFKERFLNTCDFIENLNKRAMDALITCQTLSYELRDRYTDYIQSLLDESDDIYIKEKRGIFWYHCGKLVNFDQEKLKLTFEIKGVFSDDIGLQITTSNYGSLDVEIEKFKHGNYREYYQSLRFTNHKQITREEYENKEKEIDCLINECQHNEYNGFKCGDKVLYASPEGLKRGVIIMIKDNLAYLNDGSGITLDSKYVEKR